MLKSVMRRFGVGHNGLERPPTYLEALLMDAQSQIEQRLSQDTSCDPVIEIADALVRIEAQRDHFEPPDPSLEHVQVALADYLHLLIDNDAFPPRGQLSDNELVAIRDFLVEAAGGGLEVLEQSERVKLMIEEKFNAGQFRQAARLLDLFVTTPDRERNNERTLFYEEMFARFGVIRLNRLPGGQIKKFHDALKRRSSPTDGFLEAVSWLSEHASVEFHCALRVPQEVAHWEEVLGALDDGDQAAVVADMLPPVRWRMISEFRELGPIAALAGAMGVGLLYRYFRHLLKVSYFIVLVTGKTGFEPFLSSFFSWVDANLGRSPTLLLPAVHLEATMGQSLIEASVSHAIGAMPEADELLEQCLNHEAIEEALDSLCATLLAIDPNDIPPGDYDLTSLVIDQITGLEAEDPVALLRIHRIG